MNVASRIPNVNRISYEAQNSLVFQAGKPYALGRVQPDGRVVVDQPGDADVYWLFLPATGELRWGSALGSSPYQALTSDQLEAMHAEQAHFLENASKQNAAPHRTRYAGLLRLMSCTGASASRAAQGPGRHMRSVDP